MECLKQINAIESHKEIMVQINDDPLLLNIYQQMTDVDLQQNGELPESALKIVRTCLVALEERLQVINDSIACEFHNIVSIN